MPKEIKIGEKILQFKDEQRGLDFYNAITNPQIKESMATTIQMIANASYEPKLSKKDILMLPIKEFHELLNGFNNLYGIPRRYDFLGKE